MSDDVKNLSGSSSSSFIPPPSSLSPPVPQPSSVPSLPQRSFLSRWRNAILGTLLVIGGLSAAAVTLLARHSDNYALAAVAAVLSLVSAALMLIFVVPPLARSARLEVKRLLPIKDSGGGISYLLVVVGLRPEPGNNLLSGFSSCSVESFVGTA